MTIRLSDKAEAQIEEIKKRYPSARSAIMPALYIAQEELGILSNEAIEWAADRIGIAPVAAHEVATFYTMFYKRKLGRYHFQVCRTLPCALRGAKKISQCLHKILGVAPNVVTADGLFSFEEVECLGSCGTAPMCQVNDTFFENLTPEKLEDIISRIRETSPVLSYSTINDTLGEGLAGYPKSEVVKD